VKNFVKLKRTYAPDYDVKLDACAIMAGATHPLMQTFLGPKVSENVAKYARKCPWGPGLFEINNFTIDGNGRGNFGLKRTGRYRNELEFTCGQNLPLFTMKFFGKRNLTTAD
jgi:hypothetical protein